MNSGIKRIERFIIVVLLTFPTSAWALSAPPEKEPGTSAKDKKIAKGTSQSVAGEHASGSVLRWSLLALEQLPVQFPLPSNSEGP